MKTTTRKPQWVTAAERSRRQRESLDRATSGASIKNDVAVIAGFEARGLMDVQPRVDVFTFNAWKAQGRSVKPGEKGVQIVTMLPVNAPRDPQEPQPDADEKRPQILKTKTVTVFHVTQTETDEERAARRAQEPASSAAPSIPQSAPVRRAAVATPAVAAVAQDSLF